MVWFGSYQDKDNLITCYWVFFIIPNCQGNSDPHAQRCRPLHPSLTQVRGDKLRNGNSSIILHVLYA